MALTDHIDRSSGKQLLRGRIGLVHSWVLDDKETSVFENGKRVLKHLPRVIYVKFFLANGEECEWKLEGTDEYGLYPIVAKSSSWFLDKGRNHPVLKITRRQFPLAPAFAITSHAAQGQT